ncbi:MAG: AmmeMemoRadiSam system protein A [Gammaproteobacteria bacterium]|nr:AmmeMemoRadiSam system protein A [Gammaproteobacteria bacterium]
MNPQETGLSRERLEQLHRIASAAVEAGAKPREPEPMERLKRLLEGVPSELETPSGAFVALEKQGRLRGCIGYIQPHKPLFQTVAENGINAALCDRRFSPLAPGELDGLEVEVSVLTPPETVDSYLYFDLGEEGVILEKNGHSAVFLPEVAVEQGWDREQTLTQLSQKAGLPPDAWRQGASFKTFRSIKYSAPRTGE